MRILLLAIMLALSACKKDDKTGESITVVDQCLRRVIFHECLQAVPTGPTHTVASNDWDEVISECASTAYYQSLQTRNGRRDDTCIRQVR